MIDHLRELPYKYYYDMNINAIYCLASSLPLRLQTPPNLVLGYKCVIIIMFVIVFVSSQNLNL